MLIYFMNDKMPYQVRATYEKVSDDKVIKSGQPLTLCGLIGFLGTHTLLP